MFVAIITHHGRYVVGGTHGESIELQHVRHERQIAEQSNIKMLFYSNSQLIYYILSVTKGRLLL